MTDLLTDLLAMVELTPEQRAEIAADFAAACEMLEGFDFRAVSEQLAAELEELAADDA